MSTRVVGVIIGRRIKCGLFFRRIDQYFCICWRCDLGAVAGADGAFLGQVYVEHVVLHEGLSSPRFGGVNFVCVVNAVADTMACPGPCLGPFRTL